jgi:SPP1 gp7 family putative phage head morphogenesis protein
MTITPGPRRLVGVADDYAKALDQLERRAVRNTKALLRRSLQRTLADLKRSYALYLEALGPMSRDPSGQYIRRPGSYTSAEATAKFQAILRDASGFLPEQELQQWQVRYQSDLREAATLGVELASDLNRLQQLPTPAPGMGPTTPEEVRFLGQELVDMLSRPPGSSPFAGVNPDAIRAAALQASAYIQGEVARFRDQIVQIVGEGASRGWGSKRLERDIRQALQGAKDPNGITKRLGLEQRAELIARTELAAAYSNGTLRTAQARGVAYVRLLASNDERTCPTCASRNGRVYPVDRITVPLHPRCRCVLVEVNNEAVTETDPALRSTLLDNQRWQEEHDRGVEAYAEGRHQERIKVLQGQIDRAVDGDRKDALSAQLQRVIDRGPDMVKARAELAQALRTPTASERRLFGKDAATLRESVPLFD